MELLSDVWAFVATGANWVGENGILQRTLDHAGISLLAVVLAAAVAIPPAVYLGHTGRGGAFAVSVVNLGRAIPSFAIVALFLPVSIRIGLGLGFWPTLLALLALALPPLFTNSLTGVREVDADLKEAAIGMGLRPREVLFDVELPLAAPIILAAVRVSAVQVVATATLGALVAWGGLGRYIIDGFAQGDHAEILVGALLVAGLSVAVDAVVGSLGTRLLPKGAVFERGPLDPNLGGAPV